MKTRVLILITLLLCPLGAMSEDCFLCPVMNIAKSIFPNPPTADIRRVVAPLVTIQTPALARNPSAEYCVRNESLVDTIVFHHSGGPAGQTVEALNSGHVERQSGGNAWLMMGYHYAISAPYPGVRGSGTVSQGRPFNISGAHVGTGIYANTSTATANLLRQNANIRCGRRGGRFVTPSDRFNASGQAKGNYTTVGVVLIGNYSVRTASNPDGYPPGQVRYPSEAAIDTAGRLACELQRRHPRITRITWHSSYHSTDCPGTVRNRIQEIKNSAARFGCRFN